jgi:hypothetical protein
LHPGSTVSYGTGPECKLLPKRIEFTELKTQWGSVGCFGTLGVAVVSTGYGNAAEPFGWVLFCHIQYGS